MIVPGVDTIVGLLGNPPRVITLERDDMIKAEELKQAWNKRYIAFMPYCFKCKEPLDWHIPPGADGIALSCPKCKREWIKGWFGKEQNE